MKQSRFIELLNLYVDQQISPEEAAELESVVNADPVRRRTYAHYCRMQRACALLGQTERDAAPTSFAFERSLQEADRKIARASHPRTSARPGFGWLIGSGAGLAAMAACVAIIFVVSPQDDQSLRPVEISGSGPIASNQPVPTALQHGGGQPTTSPSTLAVASIPSAVAGTKLVFTSHKPLVVAVNEAEEIAEAAEVNQAVAAWAQSVSLEPRPVVVDADAFKGPATLQQDNRVFRSRRPMQATAEFTAFQFQR